MSDEYEGVAHFQVPPIIKRVRVKMEPEAAFRRFAEELDQWWPLASHSVFQENSASCTIEPWEGGKIIERSNSGKQSQWGTVEEWAPPETLKLKWHAGRPSDQEQRVELSFKAVETGLTEVVLSHSGWEKLGSVGKAARDSYENGWSLVLARAFGDVEVNS